MTLATIIDLTALWQTVVFAFVAGVGTTVAFSLSILGFTRFAEASRNERGGEAFLFAGLALFGLLATAAAIAFGVVVMTTK
jgi:hypothetical protein